jgi:hypothetical protein
MKPIILLIFILLANYGCNTPKTAFSERNAQTALVENDTVSIANTKLEYEILVIEPGFNTWLAASARPEGYYTQSFLESRNNIYVLEWNRRVRLPGQFNPELYELQIDYNPNTDYGYDVNYQLYNYFIYFQLKYQQRLAPFVVRI